MTEIYLVRHGQASFGKRDYDELSSTGHQQSVWLGEYLAERGIEFEAMFHGSLKRHRQTAEGICSGYRQAIPATENAEIDEFDFQCIIEAFLRAKPELKPNSGATPKDYYRLLKQAMLAWSQDGFDLNGNESWNDFAQRTQNAFDAIANERYQRVLVVTSGGVIAMLLGHLLGCDATHIVNMNLQIRNASFSQCLVTRGGRYLSSFNAISHLDTPARQHLITYS